MIRVTVATVFLLATAPAWADCDHFKWSVARERGWFASPEPLPAQSGIAKTGAGYEVTLAKGLALPFPPERAPEKDTYAAVVRLPDVKAGYYQFTLSQEGWIDVVQSGAIVKSKDFSGQRDCSAVRKSVRFQLGDGVATIEISNISSDKINFAAAPAE